MDFASTLRWGGGLLALLLAVAVAGFSLPGLARLGVLVVLVIAAKQLDRLEDGPERSVLRPAAGLAVAWLALAWGLGLLEPFVALALVALLAACAALWWHYGALIAAEEPQDLPRALTPDERLDQLLEEAPFDGLPTEDIVAAMDGQMSRSTVQARLRERLADGRAWKIRHGRWRARPGGVEPEGGDS